VSSSSWIGFVAGVCTTASFVPQVWKTWRTRKAEDLSGAMLAAFVTGVALWLVYGIRLVEPAIIATNAVTLLLTIPLLVMKLRFGRR